MKTCCWMVSLGPGNHDFVQIHVHVGCNGGSRCAQKGGGSDGKMKMGLSLPLVLENNFLPHLFTLQVVKVL